MNPVASAFGSQTGKLGRLTQQLLDTLIALIGEDSRIGYLDAYDRLFPDDRRSETDKQKADKAFSKLRRTLLEIASDHGVGLKLEVDRRRSADPATRHLWFAAEDDAGERITEYSRTATQAVTDFPQEQRAPIQGATLTCLLVYAGRDRQQARTLIEALSARLEAAGHNWDLCDYRYVPPGEILDVVRLRQQRSADLTLFLLSPELISNLRSDRGFRTDRPLIPLVLRQVDDAYLNGTVLEGRTPFRGSEGKTWVQPSGSRQGDWADRALAGILERVRPADPYAALTAARLRQPEDCLPEHYADQILKGHADSEGRAALGFLRDWLADLSPDAHVFCAIFGELGMGKTTLCQRLTRDPLARRHEELEPPLPVYLDLLPFDARQVETYFRQVFLDEPALAAQVIEMLDRVHDLRELGSRPYNLRLIQDQVERIEAIHRQGGKVGVADLYEGLVHQWTRRLWAHEQKSLDDWELEGWLLDQLAADPRAQLQYRAYLDREEGLGILQEDLRNARFLVREGEEGFRFAHSSIMEFFLARGLLRALEQAGDPPWEGTRSSPRAGLDRLGHPHPQPRDP